MDGNRALFAVTRSGSCASCAERIDRFIAPVAAAKAAVLRAIRISTDSWRGARSTLHGRTRHAGDIAVFEMGGDLEGDSGWPLAKDCAARSRRTRAAALCRVDSPHSVIRMREGAAVASGGWSRGWRTEGVGGISSASFPHR